MHYSSPIATSQSVGMLMLAIALDVQGRCKLRRIGHPSSGFQSKSPIYLHTNRAHMHFRQLRRISENEIYGGGEGISPDLCAGTLGRGPCFGVWALLSRSSHRDRPAHLSRVYAM